MSFLPLWWLCWFTKPFFLHTFRKASCDVVFQSAWHCLCYVNVTKVNTHLESVSHYYYIIYFSTTCLIPEQNLIIWKENINYKTANRRQERDNIIPVHAKNLSRMVRKHTKLTAHHTCEKYWITASNMRFCGVFIFTSVWNFLMFNAYPQLLNCGTRHRR